MTARETREIEEQTMAPALYLARRSLRHWGVFAIVLVLGLLTTAVIAHYTPQVYRSEAVILYRNVNAGRPGYGDGDSSRRLASRLQDMLLSQDRLRRIIGEQHLYPKTKNLDEATDEMRKKVLFRARDGSTFLVSFDADSPAQAQAVTARLASTLIEDNTRMRLAEANETRRFLDQERVRLGQEVQAKEAALAAFFQAHPEVANRGSSEATPAPGGIDDLERELARVRQGSDSPSSAPSKFDADLFASVRRAEVEAEQAERDVADKSDKLTDAHPDLIAAKERAARAKASLQRMRESAGLTRPAPAKAEGEGAKPAPQVTAIEEQIARLRKSYAATGRRPSRQALQLEVTLEGLRHDLEQARARLAGLEDKQFQAALVAKLETNGEMGQLAVLDPASRPGLPFTDVRKKVALAGFVLALLLAAAAAVLRARTDDQIRDRLDAQWAIGKPVLALVATPPSASRSAAHV